MSNCLVLVGSGWRRIDVHLKSKSMQKVGSSNSTVELLRKVLQVYSVVFAIVSVVLFAISPNGFVAWTFLTTIAFMIAWPYGALNLVRLLTNSDKTGCTTFCKFTLNASKAALNLSLPEERRAVLAACDEASNEGKFLRTRYNMARMVEKTFFRSWVGVGAYIVSAVAYLIAFAAEVGAAL